MVVDQKLMDSLLSVRWDVLSIGKEFYAKVVGYVAQFVCGSHQYKNLFGLGSKKGSWRYMIENYCDWIDAERRLVECDQKHPVASIQMV